MNSKLSRFALLTSKITRQHVQLVLTLSALVLLVLGIGAPDIGGGVGH